MKIQGRIASVFDVRCGEYKSSNQFHSAGDKWQTCKVQFVPTNTDEALIADVWGGEDRLKTLGISVGSEGMATITFSIRNWEGKEYQQIKLEGWVGNGQQVIQSAADPKPEEKPEPETEEETPF